MVVSMNTSLLLQFTDLFQQFTIRDLPRMDAIFSDQIEFIDPLRKIHGLDAYKAYLGSLYANTSECKFIITSTDVLHDSAWIQWLMICQHPRLNAGKTFQIEGVTHLRFQEKIVYQRDYYDLGAMIYENLPLLNRLIRWIKQRLKQA